MPGGRLAAVAGLLLALAAGIPAQRSAWAAGPDGLAAAQEESPPAAAAADSGDQWLWWTTYLALAAVGVVAGFRRGLRLALLRWLAPRLPGLVFRPLQRLLSHRVLWLAVGTVSLFGVFLLVGCVLMYHAERGVNDKFDTLEEASHSTLIYLFSGVEDRTPKTTWGWRCFGALALAGLGLTAYFTGRLVFEIIRGGTPTMEGNVARQTFLLIGWNPRAKRVVEDLFKAFRCGLEEHLITVLSEERVVAAHHPDLDARGVTFVTGDSSDKRVLERIGAHEAHSVIIMANKKAEDPDARAALVVLALRGLFQDKRLPEGRRPRVCVEVVHQRKTALLRDAGADETVCHEDYGLGILAQAAMVANIGEVYHELLSYNPATCEIFVLRGPRPDGGDVPADVWGRLLEGKTFAEAADLFTRGRDARNPAILLGVRRGGRLLLNPREPVTLQPGDDLVTVAYTFPSLDHFRQFF
jgi:voltage-gated potassium channel Kch